MNATTEHIKTARKVFQDWCRDNNLAVDVLAASDLVQKIAEALTLSHTRVPKVRTSHRRNKEEAARLQALVNEKYATDKAPPIPRPSNQSEAK